jgi:hypothetical protein
VKLAHAFGLPMPAFAEQLLLTDTASLSALPIARPFTRSDLPVYGWCNKRVAR